MSLYPSLSIAFSVSLLLLLLYLFAHEENIFDVLFRSVSHEIAETNPCRGAGPGLLPDPGRGGGRGAGGEGYPRVLGGEGGEEGDGGREGGVAAGGRRGQDETQEFNLKHFSSIPGKLHGTFIR